MVVVDSLFVCLIVCLLCVYNYSEDVTKFSPTLLKLLLFLVLFK